MVGLVGGAAKAGRPWAGGFPVIQLRSLHGVIDYRCCFVLWAGFTESFEFFEGNYGDYDVDFFEGSTIYCCGGEAAAAAVTIRSRPRATGSGRQCLV